MGFKIIGAYGACSDESTVELGGKPRTGRSFGGYKGGTLKYRVLDDDREHYYTALCDTEDDSEHFLYWAMRDAGATLLEERVTGPDGKRSWVMVMEA